MQNLFVKYYHFLQRFLANRQVERGLLPHTLWGSRAIEYSFVTANIGSGNNYKVLDIGCAGSPLTTILCSLGFEVYGVDLMPSPIAEYPNLTFFQGDINSLDFKESFFERIVAVSTIEHIGLSGRYGSYEDNDGDKITLQKVGHLLKPDGLFLLTVPYGVPSIISPYHRVYDKNVLLQKTPSNLHIIKEEFYLKDSNHVWTPCTEKQARTVKPSHDIYALGLFVFKKDKF